MRKCLALLLLYLLRFALWFRYRVTVKGLETLTPERLNHPGGILFLPNHPTVFVDPTLVVLAIWKKFSVRPVIVEYMYYTPLIYTVMRFIQALPIPTFSTTSNSLKKRRADQVLETMIQDLKKGENFLLYPAGKTKHQAREIISASGVHRILQAAPETNVVLVRTTGLWGSTFSRALNGQTPDIFKTVLWGIKVALKNLLFFTPRRNVTLEFVPAGPDFPYHSSRLELNRYLENWYNRPDGILPQQGEEPGESLYLVSYSLWKQELPKITVKEKGEWDIDLAAIPLTVQEKVKKKLGEMTHRSPDLIKPEMNLSSDLGLDSLDNAELLSFLDDEFEVSGVPVRELSTVSQIMGLAAKQLSTQEEIKEDVQNDLSSWKKPRPHRKAFFPPGKTMHEVFLHRCQYQGKDVVCGDARAGILTYSQAKLRVLLLAEAIRHMPGKYIGVMLPSSVAAYLTILACQLAGKIPLMVNWTIGIRHLESVVALTQVQVVLSSWAFLDRLENVDFNGLENLIVTLEDLRHQFHFTDKLKAYYRSWLFPSALLSLFKVQNLSSQDPAVLLFTSGTENLPKGVPLSHENILSNQKATVDEVELFEDDILLGILPPFHAFGFTVSGLLPLLAGIRVAYYPDPTNGSGIAHAIEEWETTLICGAPSFLKGIFKNATPEQLKTLRLCFTGAERAPDDLFHLVNRLKHCCLLEGYGITECAPVLTANLSGDRQQGVGKPLPGVELCVVNLESHQLLPPGERGLILARGPNVFQGYLNKGLSSPFLQVNGQQWYSTGDLGYLNSENALIISGRLKRFIKIGGEMISLAAIEEALQKTIGKQKVENGEENNLAVCAKEEAGEKTKIFVFTTLSFSPEEANRSLKEAGFSNLVKVYQVKQLDEIPLMGSGKINYRALEGQIPL